jgi:hypothetical protein
MRPPTALLFNTMPRIERILRAALGFGSALLGGFLVGTVSHE